MASWLDAVRAPSARPPAPPPPSLEPIWACRASQLSSGPNGHHICTVLDSGDVKCWGHNLDGQLGIDGTSTVGNGTGIAMAELPAVTLGDRASAISAGESHTCAILNSGELKCWGLGSEGRLGYDSNNNVGGGQPYQLVMANLPAVNLGAGRTALASRAVTATGCPTYSEVEGWRLQHYKSRRAASKTRSAAAAVEPHR